MTALEVLRFAAGALRGHSLRTGLSLLGVAVGVTSVVLLTSLGEGARLYVVGEFSALGSNLLIITPGKTETTGFAPPVGGAPHDLTMGDAEALRRLSGVRRVAPMTLGTATIRAGNLTRDTIVVGTTAEWREVRHITMAAGEFLPPGVDGRGGAVAVIGRTIERDLYSGRSAVGEFLRVGEDRFRVIGVIAARGMSLGNNLDEVVILPVSRHMQMFNQPSLMRVLVEMTSHDQLAAGQAAAIAALRSRHDGEEDVTVVTQDSMVATFDQILTMLTTALAGIAAISLSVAGVGIMNVMLVSVSERTREIGLLKALGATPGQVLRLFLTEAATLSAGGGAVGLAAAWALVTAARTLYPDFPLQPPSWASPAAVAVSLVVGMLFGVLPARRAAALDPISALTRR